MKIAANNQVSTIYQLSTIKRIVEIEERKGRLKDSFFSDEVKKLSHTLKGKRVDYKRTSKNRQILKKEIEELNEQLSVLKDKKLETIFDKIDKDKQKVELTTCIVKGKTAYCTNDLPSMLVCQLIKLDLRSSYRIEPSDRNEIVGQLKELLDNPMPKTVIRADVNSFFESIPQAALLEKIEQDGFVSSRTVKSLKRIFYSFNQLSDNTGKIGIPRGMCFSSYLAELYLKEFDKAVQRIDGVFFYRRYVDDIILVANSSMNTPEGYWRQLEEVIEEVNLSLHEESEKKYLGQWTAQSSVQQFDYLGYHWHYEQGQLVLTMTQKRFRKYLVLLDSIFAIYTQCASYRAGKNELPVKYPLRKDALKQLFQRLRVLTGNGLLSGRKSYVATGIYYNHRFLTNLKQLDELDDWLKLKVLDLDFPNTLFRYSKGRPYEEYVAMIRKKLLTYSFRKNFEGRNIMRCPYYNNVQNALQHIYLKHQADEQD